MQKPLSAETIARVKSTVPALVIHGATITQVMYTRMFKDDQIRALFNQANQGEGGRQVHALAGAILAYAQNIDNLDALAPVVERIAQKHIGYDVLPEHYPFVASALLGAIAEVLGNAATDEILDAWGEAYWFLAEILKARESAIRSDIQRRDGGWTGWRKFVVAEKIKESSVITSFILRPADGGSVVVHKPGQYLTFRFTAAEGLQMKRNYSISSAANGEYYRISVKREANGKGGSRYLHDVVSVGSELEATPPAGDFYLPDDPQRPVVLLSGGVGLTPMVSMAETIANHHPKLETYFVHGTMNSETHAMGDHLKIVAQRHGRTSVTTFYSEPRNGDEPGKTHDANGFITMDWLQLNTPLDNADLYLCGPTPFLRAFVNGLARNGVPSDRVHYEFFGPAGDLQVA
jgi:nitric oxide dioxygenase